MKLIGIVMVGNSNYIGTSLSGSIQEVKLKGKNRFSFLNKKSDIKSNWVGHSKLKQLEINDFFDRKKIIADLEDELNGELK